MTNLCAVGGPTASGKTALSVELALRLGGEVVSFDSMQVYRDLSVGTAKPDMEERCGVPHHLFDLLSPGEDFSCADFCTAARPVIRDISDRGRLPILCGGTGLYLDSLLAGDGLSAAGADDELRRKYTEMAETEGADAVHRRLREIDPDAADAIHKNNVKRVIRAIEIFEVTGVTKTEWDRRSAEAVREFDSVVFVISFSDRELLYRRIEARVDIMMKSGIVDEARMLYDAGLLRGGSGVAQAIGYKEFVPYFEGARTLAEVRDDIVLATRHYAKRQMTWFRRNRNAIPLIADEGGKMRSLSSIANEAENIVRERFLL